MLTYLTLHLVPWVTDNLHLSTGPYGWDLYFQPSFLGVAFGHARGSWFFYAEYRLPRWLPVATWSAAITAFATTAMSTLVGVAHKFQGIGF